MQNSTTDDGLTVEAWLPIPGYEGAYDVSTFGRVRSHWRGRITLLKPGPIQGRIGYLRVTLRSFGGQPKITKYVHNLVLTAFVGPRPPGMMGLHGDGIVENCKLSNLRWGTPSENSQDRIRHGRHFCGAKNPNRRLTPRQVRRIRSEYSAGRFNQAQLGAMFGVSQVQISRIILNQSWSHPNANA